MAMFPLIQSVISKQFLSTHATDHVDFQGSIEKNNLGGKLGLRAVLAAPGGGCERGLCPLPREAQKLSPF